MHRRFRWPGGGQSQGHREEQHDFSAEQFNELRCEDEAARTAGEIEITQSRSAESRTRAPD